MSLSNDLWDLLVAAGRAQQADADRNVTARMEHQFEEEDVD